MALQLPPGFIHIREANERRDEQPYNIIGLCTYYLPPAQSRGTDLTMKLCLWDSSFTSTSDLDEDGMAVRFFHSTMWEMPPVHETGDVVILKSLRTKNVRGDWLGLSSKETTHQVISGTSLLDCNDESLTDAELRDSHPGCPDGNPKQCERPNLAELTYARSLIQLRDRNSLRGPAKSTALEVATIIRANGGQPSTVHQKFRLVKDLQNPADLNTYQFVDLVGEVRRVYLTRNPLELRLTDYTEHPLLYDYPEDVPDQDSSNQHADTWTGPWGKRTINLNLWDENGDHVRQLAQQNEIQLGMFMRIKNVQIKMDRNMCYIEGHLRGSKSGFGPRISLHKPGKAESDERLKELLVKKREYEREMKSKKIGIPFFQVEPNKRAAPSDEGEAHDQAPSKKGTNAKKKEKRLAQKAGKHGNHSSTFKSVTISGGSANKHVRCEAIDIPLTTVSAITEDNRLERSTPEGNPFIMPFQNCKYKSRVQIIDFFPDNLKDFAVPYRQPDYDLLSGQKDETTSEVSLSFAQSNPRDVKWEWHFFLLVGDPPQKPQKDDAPTILLQVTGQDGDYLLNMEACNLREHSREFANLREKLFVLWGDLEEKKTEHSKTGEDLKMDGIEVSSHPFECLIKEYGVSARTADGVVIDDKYERMFGLFKTNIG